MRSSRRRLGILPLVALVLAALAACAGGPAPEESTARPVTTEEAQLLAVARFNNFDAGSRPFASALTESGVRLRLQGWVDYAAHVGYASVADGSDPHALLWTATTVGVIPRAPDAKGDPVLPPPGLSDPEWISHPLDAASSRLDALLMVVGSLASDRPDNPLLVQQSGALWLRDDEIDDTPVTVFAAPPSDEPRDASSPPITADTSPLRLWVDRAGLLRRAEVRLGDDWTIVDFADAPGEPLVLAEVAG